MQIQVTTPDLWTAHLRYIDFVKFRATTPNLGNASLFYHFFEKSDIDWKISFLMSPQPAHLSQIAKHMGDLFHHDPVAFRCLTNKQLYVFYHRIRDPEVTKKTFQQLADELGISKQAAHRIHSRATDRLAKSLGLQESPGGPQ